MTRVATRLSVLALRACGVGALAALTAGLAPASGQAMSAGAYVTDVNAHAVFQLGIGTGGLLTALAPATVEAGEAPVGVAVTPDGKSVYVADFDGGVSQYDVGAGGLLTAKTPATVTAGTNPEWLAVSPDGKSVYVTDHNGATVSQFDVGAGEALSAKTPATVPTGATPSGVAVSPDGRSVYVDDQAASTVSQYDVGAGGLLTAKSSPTVMSGTNPTAIAVTPDGQSVYVVDAGSETISQYDVAPGGLLVAKSTPAVAATPAPVGIAISPDGRSVYVTNHEASGSVSQFDVGAGGLLSAKTPSRVAAGVEPLGIAVSPDGKSVYTADKNGFVSQFDVGAGGLLSPKTPATVPAGEGPSGIALLPDQGPVASFSATPASAGSASVFDGSASSDLDGAVVRYDWSFGDGTSAADAGPRPTHVYASAGSYVVSLTVSDDAGCSTAFVFTGQTASCVGGPQALATSTIAVPAAATTPPLVTTPRPAISSARLSNKRFRVAAKATAVFARKAPLGTVFRFTLSAAAKLRIVITRPAPGLRHGHSCLAPTAKLRHAHAKRCTRTLTVGTLTRSNEPKGADSVPFSGRIGHRALAPRAYHALLSASDAGGRSNPVTLAFAVVR